MRLHSLKKLTLAGAEKALTVEPEFDFYRAQRVRRLELDLTEGSGPSLRLDLEYPRAAGTLFEVSLVLSGVREIVLPPIEGQLFLPELEVEDVRAHMLEGVNFELVSQYERAFRCSCRELAILDFRPINEVAT